MEHSLSPAFFTASSNEITFDMIVTGLPPTNAKHRAQSAAADSHTTSAAGLSSRKPLNDS
jgi:hypothetical protein